MATFRSDFNSVPSTYTLLKKRLTTCFQQWREQLQKQLQYHQRLRRAATAQNQRRSSGQFYKLFVRADSSIFGEKTRAHFQKFRKVFRKSEHLAPECVPRRCESKQEQLQIVAKLLSSTLIGNSFSSSSYCLTSNMIITDSTYMEVRDEHPDIDKEIRAILLANAQIGITISSIKKEYRKLTGNPFPLQENITDFLLTIPLVTAECSEIGTRVFNIKPSMRNKHLHDMVLQQRQRNDWTQSSGHGSMASYQHQQQQQPQPTRQWQQCHRRRVLHPLDNNLNTLGKSRQLEKAPLEHLANAVTVPTPTPTPTPTSKPTPMDISQGFVEHNWCYKDNWNHLNNHYQQMHMSQAAENNIICADQSEKQKMFQQQPHHHQSAFPSMANAGNVHKRRQDYTPTTLSSNTRSSESMITIRSDYDAYLLDFPLMGDDFFLYLARMELQCKFRKYEKVLQSGLCVSGQTINSARRRLRHVELCEDTQIIVNIGSVDIMKGKPLVQIEHDFRQLLNDMHKRRLVAVLTTIAPLANYRHDKDICEKILRFNNFIRNEGRHLKVIDIHSCLVNEMGIVHFDCFQNGPRSVTGSSEPYVFWNKIGRQRVLQMIEANLEY